MILHTQSKEAWFWYIPLSGDVTSICLVADNDFLLKGRGKPHEVFEEELVNCPSLLGRLANAKLVDKFHVAKEFSYKTTQHAGDGWVLVGDAFGFIDPIYSSGVYFALKSGEMAADAINEFSFGHFMKDHPQHQGNLTDILIGRIFHEGAGNIFQDMDKMLAEARKQSMTEANRQDDPSVVRT